VVNLFLKPIAKLISLPLIVLTLGLFALVVNAAMLAVTAWLTDSLSIDGFWAAFWGALIISIVLAILEAVSGTRDA
jgi:putative membrane protein